MTDSIVIIGGGQAAASCAAKLRAAGHAGPVTIIAAEISPPYQRPPLSKKYVAGELAVDRLLIRPLDWYREQKIELRCGVSVTALDPATHSLTLSDGSQLRYAKALLATGARPRRLPASLGGDLGNVLTMRDLADADALAPLLRPGAKLLVVGGGYIGLEAAAVASRKGLAVTIVEMAPRILQRVAAEPTSDYFRALHRNHGVEIREATGVDGLIGRDGRVSGVRFGDGGESPVDLAVIGIGIEPNVELAKNAGLAIENGIAVDARCRTSDPDIFAAGDCAGLIWNGERIRLESVQNAIDQAEAAALSMLGGTDSYRPKPWFWSDQYDVKLQIAGLNRGYAETVLRAGARPGSQSVWYYRDDQLIAVDAMNDALAYSIGKKVLDAGGNIPGESIADPATDLKHWLKG